MKKSNSFTDGYRTYDDSQGRGNKREWRKTFRDRISGEGFTLEGEEELPGPWKILGIPPGSTKAEIKKAYYRKVMEWHPDRNPHRIDEATEMLKKINLAYEQVS